MSIATSRRAWCAALLPWIASTAWAQLEYATYVGAQSEWTSNTRREAEGKTDEVIHSPFIGTDLDYTSLRLDANASLTAERRIYTKSIYDDQTLVSGTAGLLWRAIGERLTFDVTNTREETTLNPFRPDTQDNRQETNQLTAGGTFTQPIGRNLVRLRYAHERIDADLQQSEGKTDTAVATYVMPLSEARRVELSVTGTKSDPAQQDVELRTLGSFLKYISVSTRLDSSVSAGWQRSKERGDDGSDSSFSGFAGDLAFTYRFTPDTEVRLEAARGLDTHTNLERLNRFVPEGDLVMVNSDLYDLYRYTQLGLEVRRQVGRNDYGIGVGYGKEKFLRLERETTDTNVFANFTRRLTESFTLGTRISYGQYDRKGLDEADDEIDGSVYIAWDSGRRLSMSLGGRYRDRSGNGIGGFQYKETSAVFEIRYFLFGNVRNRRPATTSPF